MAAALFRRGTGLCVRCLHRELCRMVWRPQTVLFSSKPSDRRQPRRTHIKKAKPQPAVDVAKLLEQLFSQRRPGTAPPAAGPSKASSTSSKPPTASSVKVSTSNAPPEPAVSVFPAASGFSSVTDSSPTSTAPASLGSSAIETKVETAAEQVELNTVLPPTACMVEKNAESVSFPAATEEPLIETTIESPVEHILSPVETPETRAAVVEGPVEPTVDAAAEEVQTKVTDISHTAGEEPLIETAIESPVEASHVPVETQETGAAVVEGPEESTIDVTADVAAQKVETESTDSGVVHTVESIIETPVEPSVEARTSPLETLESRAAVVEGPVDATVDAQAVQTKCTGPVNLLHTAEEERLIETTIESSHFPVETQETSAAVVEGPVKPTIDVTVDAAAQKVENNYTEVSRGAKDEPSIETAVEPVEASHFPVETLETSAAVVEGPVKPTIDVTVDAAAQKVENNYTEVSYGAKDEPLIETAIEPAVEASPSPLETLESRSVVVEGSVETTIEAEVDTAAQAVPTNETDSGVVDVSCGAEDERLIETTIESVEASRVPVETQETSAAVVEGPVEPTINVTVDVTDSGVVDVSCGATDDPLIETAIEPAVEPSTSPVSEGTIEPRVETEAADNRSHTESAPLPLKVECTVESVDRSEEMTLESVTLHEDEVLVSSLKTDELLRTKSILDEKADKRLQELSVQTGIGPESKAAAEAESSSEDESEILTDSLSKWDSLSEDLQELEGESGMLVKELLCRVPAVLSRSTNGEKATEAEAMTLESITLARVKAEVEGLETEVLLETRNALEKEADARAKEEKMEVGPEIDDVAVFEDTTEADILALDSISEATAAIEAETSVMLEAMFGSVQPLVGQKLRRQDEAIGQETGKESEEQRASVLEAMSLESVTLAEVEAFLGTLENESLSETADYLETEAEIVAGEKKVEVEDVVASEETTEALKIESLSLPEDLQTDELMEELLFVVPGHVTAVTEGPIGQEVVRADILDDLDPVQRLFLEKIREYNNMRRLNGGLLEAEPDYEKHVSEEVAKLQRLYGGGDLSSFPQFTFTEPETDQDSK